MHRTKPGQTLTYTITLKNFGAATAMNVLVKDAVPQGTTFLNAAPAGTYTAPSVGSSGTVTWNLGSLSSGATAAVTLTVTVTARGNDLIVNTATVESSTCDPNTANNTATITSKRVTGVPGKK